MNKAEVIAAATAAVGKVIADNWPVVVPPVIEPPAPPPTPTGSIVPADIITRASAALPFAQQSSYSVQALGASRAVGAIPEDGLKSTQLPNGDSLRFGKVPDPINSVRKALLLQVQKDDATTSAGKRAEIRAPSNIEFDKTYWIAFGAYVYDWGPLAQNDEALFGAQMHTGSSITVGGPSFGLYTTQLGRCFRVQARHSTSSSPGEGNAVSNKYAEQPIPFGRWADFVLKFRHNVSGQGFLQVWMDGAQIANHAGNLGYKTGEKDYAKFGYYNWSKAAMGPSPRKVLLRSPVIIADRAGYTQEILRSHVNKE